MNEVNTKFRQRRNAILWRNKMKKLYFLILSALMLSGVYLYAATAEAGFETVRNTNIFQYKDDVGSDFVASFSDNVDPERTKVLVMKYAMAQKGYAGWGMFLKGKDLSNIGNVSFFVKGMKGSEIFYLSLKDKDDKEKKIVINTYANVTRVWQMVKIPMTDFADIDLKHITSFGFSLDSAAGQGELYINEIQFNTVTNSEEAVILDQDVAQPTLRSNRVIIDGFERPSPNDFYSVRTGDYSTLELKATRMLHDGDYAMEMDYLFQTQNPWGSWVSAHWEAYTTPVDWTGLEYFKIWIKGDGSNNVFNYNIFDAEGELWTFQDAEVLKNTNWTQITMPLTQFKLSTQSKPGNKVIDLAKIRGFEISILSLDREKTSGIIFVDQLYAVGKSMSAIWATPPSVVEKLRITFPTVGNVDFSGLIYTEFLNTPERNEQLTHYGKLIASAKVDEFSARMEIGSESQEFGQSVYSTYNPNTITTVSSVTYIGYDSRLNVSAQPPKANVPLIQVMGNNFSREFSNFTIGNIFFEYTKYTFASPILGNWGYKGATAEGDIDNLNYHAFYIKHTYDGNSIGSRLTYYGSDWKMVGYALNDCTSGLMENTAVPSNTSMVNNSEWQIKPVSNDTVYNLEFWKWFLEKKVQIQAIAGMEKYSDYATTYSTTTLPLIQPLYNVALPNPLYEFDRLMVGRIETNNLFWKGLRLAYENRYIGTLYKPTYRWEPAYFDDVYSDQKAYDFSVTQKYKGFQTSVEFEDVTRLTNSSYYRNRTNWGIGYYGFDGLDVAFNSQVKYQKYNYDSPRSMFSTYGDDFKREQINEIFVRTQFSRKIAAWFSVKSIETEWLAPRADAGDRFMGNSLFVKLEYNYNSNTKFSGEYMTTKYGIDYWEPKTWPYDDNYLKFCFSLSF